jgi:capsular exopolysaccharide synthesis family protein
MLRKVKEASVASAVRASSIRVINRAAPAARPHKPRSLRDVLLGLTTGLFAAIMFVAVRAKMDGKLREPGDVADVRIPDLGVILSSEQLLAAGDRSVSRLLRLPGGKEEDAALVDAHEEQPGSQLITWTHKPSPEAESFRAVLTSLLTATSGKRVFALTSAMPKEGKTTVTCNLAVVLAEIDRKVLVIDADLRAPRIHDVFGIRNDFGFSDIAHERHSLANRPLETLVRPTYVPNVFAIPSGPGTASIYRLLYSQRIEELLERARAEFDMVLVDTPPMLGIPDARVLARMTDGVVFVMRAGVVDRATVRAALQRFSDDCTTVVGTIVNDWKPRPDHYGYYDRYYNTRI